MVAHTWLPTRNSHPRFTQPWFFYNHLGKMFKKIHAKWNMHAVIESLAYRDARVNNNVWKIMRMFEDSENYHIFQRGSVYLVKFTLSRAFGIHNLLHCQIFFVGNCIIVGKWISSPMWVLSSRYVRAVRLWSSQTLLWKAGVFWQPKNWANVIIIFLPR